MEGYPVSENPDLTEDNLARFSVLDYAEDEDGSIVATPVSEIPLASLQGRFIGCKVTFSNGQKYWAA